MGSKKTWIEKLNDSKDLPKVVTIEGKMSRKWGEGTCAIPSPLNVDAMMKKVSKGKLVTINELRQAIAKKQQATIGCPMTTGIFAWIAAGASHEKEAQGYKRVTPYWRTLKSNGELNPKYPINLEELSERLENEGHEIISKGKKKFVKDYQQKLISMDRLVNAL